MLKLYIEPPEQVTEFITKAMSFQKSSKETCDYIVSSKFSYGSKTKKIIQDALDTYIDSDTPVLIFHVTDNCEEVNIPPLVKYFRTSIYKSKQKWNEFILPYLWDRVVEQSQSQSQSQLKRSDKPIVGFCGQVVANRQEIINAFKSDQRISTNFIIRKGFWGNKPNDPQLIQEFQKNIIDSHFTICNRGNGNFSMRFYQVLSAGRIPVLLDSDMVFPFSDEIPWQNIIVTGKTVSEVTNNLIIFWESKDIEEVQKECKRISDTYFTLENYTDKIIKSLSAA